MTNSNIKPFIYILIPPSLILWGILAALKGFEWRIVDSKGFNLSQMTALLEAIPIVITVNILFSWLFVKWLWKWKHFQGWLVPFPNLNGTWVGTIRSDWVNRETDKTIPSIPAIMTIKQNFLKISCVMKTQEMRSDSYTGEFRIDSDHQIKQLIYIYSSRPLSEPKIKKRSALHDGSVVLEIVENSVRKLEGRYWTDRGTTGEIDFEFRESRIRDQLPSELQKHPLQS